MVAPHMQLVKRRLATRGVATFLLLAAAVWSAPAKEEVAKLLAELPPQRMLDDAITMVVTRYPESTPPGAQGRSAEQLAAAQALIDRAKEIIPKLRRLIVPQTSVLDYPGLLARGNISWGEHPRGYDIYLGVYLRPHEGQGPYDFRIVFDEKGVITRVEDVRWKH